MTKPLVKIPHWLALLHRWDVVLFHCFMKHRQLPVFASVSKGVSHTADGYGYPVLAIAFYLLDGIQGAAFVATLALAFALERPLYWLLKNSFRRNRPATALPGFTSLIIPSDQFSFPSGHTSGAFLMATTLALYYPVTAPLGYSWAISVGTSRVALGVHFPGDTLAGALMGATLAWWAAGWVT